MSFHKKLLVGSAAVSGITIRAVTWDGTNDYLARGAAFTGADADMKSTTLSVWVKTSGSGNRRLMGGQGSPNDQKFFNINTNGSVTLQVFNASSPVTCFMQTNSSVIVNGTWTHIMASYDSVAGVGHFYIDDVDEESSQTINNVTASFTTTEKFVGVANNSFPNSKFDGDMADFYYNDAEYIDLSVEANRRKFISASGGPVDLGSDGSTPTGTAPIMFLSLADGDAVASFGTNKGTGGGMTTTGSFTEASEGPS